MDKFENVFLDSIGSHNKVSKTGYIKRLNQKWNMIIRSLYVVFRMQSFIHASKLFLKKEKNTISQYICNSITLFSMYIYFCMNKAIQDYYGK